MGAASGAPCCNHATKEVVVKCKEDAAPEREPAGNRCEDEVTAADPAKSSKLPPLATRAPPAAGGPSKAAGQPAGGAQPQGASPGPEPEPGNAVEESAVDTASGESEPVRVDSTSKVKTFAWRGRQQSVYKVEDLSSQAAFHAEPILKDPARSHASSGRRLSFQTGQGDPSDRKVERKATGFVHGKDIDKFLDECDDD